MYVCMYVCMYIRKTVWQTHLPCINTQCNCATDIFTSFRCLVFVTCSFYVQTSSFSIAKCECQCGVEYLESHVLCVPWHCVPYLTAVFFDIVKPCITTASVHPASASLLIGAAAVAALFHVHRLHSRSSVAYVQQLSCLLLRLHSLTEYFSNLSRNTENGVWSCWFQ